MGAQLTGDRARRLLHRRGLVTFDGDEEFVRQREVCEEERESANLREVGGQKLENIDVETDAREAEASHRHQDHDKANLNLSHESRCSR